MVSKSETEVSLESAEDVDKVFFTNARKRTPSIPFIRNLVEFTRRKDDPDYLKLTSPLHWKKESVVT